MQELDQAIRERAYHLWIAAGRPDGHSDGYWLEAQRELLTTAVAGSEPAGPAKAARKSTDKAKARPKRKAA